MDGRLSRLTEKDPPPRPPLITPSTSPPISRQRNRDKPPTPKRPRLSSTPSSSSSLRFSTSYLDPRLESSSRLFQFWDGLAERYNRPIDEDDIVDIYKLAIVKDRGITAKATKNYEIGSLTITDADAEVDGTPIQVTEEEETAEEEESADELDLISSEPVSEKLEYYKTWYVPPADETNSEDAEAFREFEEAEKKRRELHGEEDEEDPVERGGEEEFALHPPPELSDDDEQGEDANCTIKLHRRKSMLPPVLDEDSSEDQLATWAIDDAPVTSLNDDDIIDLTNSPPRPVVPTPRGRSRSIPPPAQMRSRSRRRSKLTQSAVQMRIGAQTPEPRRQLLTPPRSSSAAESIHSVPDPPAEKARPRAETPSPRGPKFRTRYTPRPRTPSENSEADEPATEAKLLPPMPIPSLVGPPEKAEKKRLPRRNKAEVVIMVPKKNEHKSKSDTNSHAPPSSPEPPSSPSIPAAERKTAKGKGKEKELPPLPLSAASASKPSRARTRSQSRPRRSTTPPSPQPRPVRGVKRRRISSLSPLRNDSPAGLVDASPDENSGRRGRSMRASFKSGHSSDVPPPTSSPISLIDEDGDGYSQASIHINTRARSQAPHIPTSPYPPYTSYHSHRPSTSERHERYDSFPTSTLPSMQDPRTQYIFAQAWHNLSYLMASGVFPTYPSPGPGYSPSLPFPAWPPHTPSHQRYDPATMHSTPIHNSHLYPYSFDPIFSSSTLPPSSPIPSSPAVSSPILRPASVPPGQRSRSRGRRVSFKLDENDRPPPLTPPGHSRTDGDAAPSVRSGGYSASAASQLSKDKGKSRALPEREEEESEDEQATAASPRPRHLPTPRGRAPQRARTPGPPSQRGHSIPVMATRSTTKRAKLVSKRKD